MGKPNRLTGPPVRRVDRGLRSPLRCAPAWSADPPTPGTGTPRADFRPPRVPKRPSWSGAAWSESSTTAPSRPGPFAATAWGAPYLGRPCRWVPRTAGSAAA